MSASFDYYGDIVKAYVDARDDLSRYAKEWGLIPFVAGTIWGRALERTRASTSSFRSALIEVMEEDRRDRQRKERKE